MSVLYILCVHSDTNMHDHLDRAFTEREREREKLIITSSTIKDETTKTWPRK